ncbi:DNA cytosine methyltransferase [Streptantibioticus silvisoli]|uniref:DNA (cytosine-5-)-methyltransferase n=1 Tax=Streptantibioticus silvisoli TaxID=2705255 RepID=A0ABT6W4V8_9ACTN|nr:DNA cytosine methyltransferase [Streptantibioticus silvisoli]MDI5965790.1 DNA cytosine methyltransferase [Streptantibioticus silvisoli]
MTADLIVHGFAGIGWSEGMLPLGLADVGLELDWAACRTRSDAGHATVQCDVADYPTEPFRGRTVGKVDSPPCQAYSRSGGRLGLHDRPLVAQAVEDLARGRDTRAAIKAACLDERSILTAEPMRWHYDLRPQWIAMEQVPAVLPLWGQYVEILRDWGYSAACGVLDAADFGLPQHRKRAVLVASRVAEVRLPEPTHGFGLGLLPHVSMAEAIGWGYTRRPAPTVTGGGTATGGAEPFGNGTRRAMKAAAERVGEWRERVGVTHMRPTLAEAAVLQGFRPGLVFAGRAGQRYLQVGNAVAVPFATAVLSAATGLPSAAALPAAA